MIDFWASFGREYTLFSNYCFYTDWCAIIDIIVEKIEMVNDGRSMTLLDVGAGQGINTKQICELLVERTRCRHAVDLVEPSSLARVIAEAILSPTQMGGLRRNVFHSLGDVGANVYDAILFIHSTYYIEEFPDLVKRLILCNLRRAGRVLFLAMPDTSKFFLGGPSLPNTANKLRLALEDIEGLSIPITYPLRSRFWIGDAGHLQSQDTVDALKRFFQQDGLTRNEFLNQLQRRSADGVIDFEDELIVVDKKQ